MSRLRVPRNVTTLEFKIPSAAIRFHSATIISTCLTFCAARYDALFERGRFVCYGVKSEHAN